MKPKKVHILGIFALCVALIVVLSVYLAGPLSGGSKVSKECPKTYASHIITISNDVVMPKITLSAKCDTLTIVNRDNQARLIAFGNHDHHVVVDGVEQRYLTKNQSFTIVLSETGKYTIHDHYQDEIQATFVVSN